jgi:hypothetical protein
MASYNEDDKKDRIESNFAGTVESQLRSNNKRSISNPLKQIPSHFNHGARNYKHCIVCEGNPQKAPKSEKVKDKTLLAPT